MWGLFVFAPFMANHVEPWLNDHLGNAPIVGALFTGPPIGIGMLTGGHGSRHHGHPVHRRGGARRVQRRAGGAARIGGRAGRDALGNRCSRVTLPYTRSAIVGAIFLGLGRALGETMAVTFVLGNAHDLSVSLLMPGNSIAAAIANEFTEADTRALSFFADRARLPAVRHHLHRADASPS